MNNNNNIEYECVYVTTNNNTACFCVELIIILSLYSPTNIITTHVWSNIVCSPNCMISLSL